MAEYTRGLSLSQGYNFKKDQQNPIGFLTKLMIGTDNFLADQTVNSPMKAVAAARVTSDASATVGDLAVVGVLEEISWAMGDTDPIKLKGTLSIAGKQAFSALLYASMIDIDVTVGFVIYEYDPLAKKYYAAFSNQAQMITDITAGSGVLGQIQKDGDNLAMNISADPHADVQSPINYGFELSVVPKPMAQTLMFATSATRKVTKNWGRVGPTT